MDSVSNYVLSELHKRYKITIKIKILSYPIAKMGQNNPGP